MKLFLLAALAPVMMVATPSAYAYHTIPPSMLTPRGATAAPAPPMLTLPQRPVIAGPARTGFVPPLNVYGTLQEKYAPRHYDYDDTPSQDFRDQHRWLEQDLHLDRNQASSSAGSPDRYVQRNNQY